NEVRSRELPATKGSELSDGNSADSRSSKATCNSLASAAVSWFLAASARCAQSAALSSDGMLRSPSRAGREGQPTDPVKGLGGSRALPLRELGRSHSCWAAAQSLRVEPPPNHTQFAAALVRSTFGGDAPSRSSRPFLARSNEARMPSLISSV